MLLGNPLSLVCGTGLDSNPQATITWISPDVSVITDSSRYRLENGPEIVQLSFTHTILSDAGMWRCNIRTESDQNVVKNENLVPLNSTVIGVVIQCDIELVIIGKYSSYRLNRL